MTVATRNRSEGTIGRSTTALVQEAVDVVNAALDTDSTLIKKEIEAVEECVVRLRDHLIAHLRRQGAQQAAALRPLLEQVNMALSLVVSIEYPAGGIHREALTETGAVLSGLLARAAAPAS